MTTPLPPSTPATGQPPGAPLVSLIVPVLRDADALDDLLADLRFGPDVEVIVVNGDPDDKAVRALSARHSAAIWLDSAAGRAVQMNRGAAAAHGRWLLFLHADVRLPEGWLDELRRLDALPGTVAGSYRFALRSSARVARLIERGVAMRVRWLGLPYGDQALFVRSTTFRQMGGFETLPLMEDVDLVRRLRRYGRLAHLDLPVLVSARRWERDGWIRRSVANVGLVILYFLGVSPEWIARRYYPVGSGLGNAPAAARVDGRPTGDAAELAQRSGSTDPGQTD